MDARERSRPSDKEEGQDVPTGPAEQDASRAVTPERPKTEGSPAQQDQDMGEESYSAPDGFGNVTIFGRPSAG